MSLAILGGCRTQEEADKKRSKLKHKELYTTASVMVDGVDFCYFVLPSKVADAFLGFDEQAEKEVKK